MKWTYLLSVIFLVLFLLLQSTSLFSLSEEEKKILPELSKSVLIEIILTYDNQMNSSEITIQNLEKLRLKDSETLKIQENLFQTSLKMQKEKEDQVIKNYFKIGGISFGVGVIATAIYMYQK